MHKNRKIIFTYRNPVYIYSLKPKDYDQCHYNHDVQHSTSFNI